MHRLRCVAGLAALFSGWMSAATPAAGMAVTKAASTWTASTGTVCLNGGPVAVNAGQVNGFSGIITVRLMGDPSNEIPNGYIRRLRYWPRVLSNAELQQVTT